MLHSWVKSREDFEYLATVLESYRHTTETHLSTLDEHSGYCVACDKVASFEMPRPADGGWRDLRESFVCAVCGLNGRMRSIIWAIKSSIASPRADFLIIERLTPLYDLLVQHYAMLVGCEYIDSSAKSGSIFVNPDGVEVRHEDLQQLSFPSDTFDITFHGDVLEHVPNHKIALSECHRTLKPGGTLLFTCPFFGQETHTMRANLHNNKVEHLLPPIFHGNPISASGSLVFTEHGWPLLDDVRDCGFNDVEIGLLYDPFQGIVSNNNPYREGHMWPIIFRAIK